MGEQMFPSFTIRGRGFYIEETLCRNQNSVIVNVFFKEPQIPHIISEYSLKVASVARYVLTIPRASVEVLQCYTKKLKYESCRLFESIE